MSNGQQVDTSNMTPEEIAELQKKNCIFCHIISGRVKSKKVYEDEHVLGILDINPANPGHVLVLPKEHAVIMPQIADADIGHMFMVAKGISSALLKALKAQGTNILAANGAVAGQKAPHFMIHIIPRFEQDGLGFVLPQNSIRPEDLDEVKRRLLPKIKEAFALTDEQIQAIAGQELSAEGQKQEGKVERNPVQETDNSADMRGHDQPEEKADKDASKADKNEDKDDEEEVDIDSLKGVLEL